MQPSQHIQHTRSSSEILESFNNPGSALAKNQDNCNMTLLKICALIGFIITVVGSISLIGLYGVEAGSVTSFFKNISQITQRAGFAIGAEPFTLAWTVMAIGSCIFTVGFFGCWYSCCHPNHHQSKALHPSGRDTPPSAYHGNIRGHKRSLSYTIPAQFEDNFADIPQTGSQLYSNALADA